MTPNTKPGLGISINEDEVRKHPFNRNSCSGSSIVMEAWVTGETWPRKCRVS